MGVRAKAIRSAALLAGQHASFLGILSGAVVGVVIVAELVGRPGPRIDDSLLPGLAFAGGALAMAPRRPWSEVLSSASSVAMAGAANALGALLLAMGGVLEVWPTIGARSVLALWTATTLIAAATIALAHWMRAHCRPIRLAIIGSAHAAEELAKKIEQRGDARYEALGYVAAVDGVAAEGASVRMLGTVAALPRIIAAHGLELLVLAPGGDRLRFYDELVGNCLASGIRIADLDHFYERAFGHVPVASINSCWFRHLLAMDRPPERRLLKRAVDLVITLVLGFLVAPLLGLLVLLIRRDGGPALFRQLRIGECGRPFTILKLRTMHAQDRVVARWTAQDDPRITGIGRVLRAIHIDELPQLLNVLRGEMSIVGPRPEQPALVDRLQARIPYYEPRHLVKPGITGWAQARCGYAGSDDGSMWKVCHDLYYLRHRSLRFDLAIMGETLYAMLVGDSPWRGAWRRLRGAVSAATPVRQLSSHVSAMPSDRRPRALAKGMARQVSSEEILVEALQSADENP